MNHIRLTAPYIPSGSTEGIPAGTHGEPFYYHPEPRPSCYTPGLRIGLSFYCTLSKASRGVEKTGTVVGESEEGGGFRSEWSHFIEVKWDDEDEVSLVHPHNILRLPTHYRFRWDSREPGLPENCRSGQLDVPLETVLAEAEFTTGRAYGATGWV